jgi:hypothetical protein
MKSLQYRFASHERLERASKSIYLMTKRYVHMNPRMRKERKCRPLNVEDQLLWVFDCRKPAPKRPGLEKGTPATSSA